MAIPFIKINEDQLTEKLISWIRETIYGENVLVLNKEYFLLSCEDRLILDNIFMKTCLHYGLKYVSIDTEVIPIYSVETLSFIVNNYYNLTQDIRSKKGTLIPSIVPKGPFKDLRFMKL